MIAIGMLSSFTFECWLLLCWSFCSSSYPCHFHSDWLFEALILLFFFYKFFKTPHIVYTFWRQLVVCITCSHMYTLIWLADLSLLIHWLHFALWKINFIKILWSYWIVLWGNNFSQLYMKVYWKQVKTIYRYITYYSLKKCHITTTVATHPKIILLFFNAQRNISYYIC